MSKQPATSFLKRFVAFIHILFACVTLVGIGFMYLNSNYGRGLDWIESETYEQSPDFNKKVQSDISNIFDYIQYQELFETGGKVDFTKPMLEITSSKGDVSYTLNDIITYGKKLGYYMDESNNYELYGPSDEYEYTEEDLERVYVRWRSYQSDEALTGPEQSYATLPELTYEILHRYSAYYSIYSRLMSDFTNIYFRVAFYSKNEAIYKVYSNAKEMSNDDMMAMGRYIYFSGDSNDLTVHTNFDSTFPSIPAMMMETNPYNSTKNFFVLGLDTTFKANDDYKQAHANYFGSTETFVLGIYLTGIGLAGSFITFLFLLFASGHKTLLDKTIHLYPIDKIKTEVMLIIMLLVTYFGVTIGAPVFSKLFHLFVTSYYWDRVNRLVAFGFMYFCLILAFFSLVRRYKAETLWSNSILKELTWMLSKHTFQYRLSLSYLIYLGVNTFSIICGCYYIFAGKNDSLESMPFLIGFGLWLIGNIAVFYFLYRNAIQTDKIYEAVEHLASGETSYKVNVEAFNSLEADLAAGLNRISDGLETALAEQVKSERLKADLITNVSHDIKTPLTSIINYVDLIKRENIQDPKIQKYLEVLDQKSHRLKTLTEDLVEASKASSGNIKLEMMDIDIVELVQQTNGEFEDKYELSRLKLVSTLPNEVIIIEADGRRLWRVLENLYNNACKYALENTRVYIGIEDRGAEVVFSIKNVSAAPLNFSPDELTERFVRGDVSRTTEGSGLGLSIAKSLTELQGGKFKLSIDGDLFKAEVAFPIKN